MGHEDKVKEIGANLVEPVVANEGPMAIVK